MLKIMYELIGDAIAVTHTGPSQRDGDGCGTSVDQKSLDKDAGVLTHKPTHHMEALRKSLTDTRLTGRMDRTSDQL